MLGVLEVCARGAYSECVLGVRILAAVHIIHTLPKLLLVNQGFLSWHIYLPETKQLFLYTETNVPRFPHII